MLENNLYNRWFKRHIRAIHRLDQCQAMADDISITGNELKRVEKMKKIYKMLVDISEERVLHYKKAKK